MRYKISLDHECVPNAISRWIRCDHPIQVSDVSLHTRLAESGETKVRTNHFT